MSDIYFSRHSAASTDSVKLLFNSSNKDWIQEIRYNSTFLFQRRNDKKELWEALDVDGGPKVFLGGRIALETAEWEKAVEHLDGGGAASKYILKEYRAKGIKGLADCLNGAFCVFLAANADETYIITDRMGFYPIYYGYRDGEIIVSSRPDAIALSDRFSELDLTSIGEYLNYGKVEHPNTYYRYIKQLAPGSIFRISREGIEKSCTYFKPEFKWQNETPKQLTLELQQALNNAVKKRSSSILGKTGVFLSGGMDSRSILASCYIPQETVAATFFDEKNEEVHVSQKIAGRYGAEHLLLQRSFEHYIENASKSASLMGGHWNVLDGHYTGFIDQLLETQVDNWLTGCFADWMFKGLASNTKYLKLFGKVIPVVKQIAEFAPVYYQPYFSMSEEPYANEIKQRKDSIYQETKDLRGEQQYWAIEKIRLFPMSREADMGGRHVLTRTLRWDPVLADNQLLEMFQKIPVTYKLNNNIWGNAVSRICGRNNDIKDNNWGARVNAGKVERILFFVLNNLERKLKKRATKESGIVTTGSWPNYRYLTQKSTELPNVWENIEKDSFHIIKEITGIDFSKEHYLSIASENLDKFYRLFTILLWLDSRKALNNSL